jgi:hypothetical protein
MWSWFLVVAVLVVVACQARYVTALEWRERVHEEYHYDFVRPYVCYAFSYDAPNVPGSIDQVVLEARFVNWMTAHRLPHLDAVYCLSLITVFNLDMKDDLSGVEDLCEAAVLAVRDSRGFGDEYFTALTVGILDHCVAAKYFE